MVQTITPVVHGGRAGRWAVAVALHALGASAAAAAFGAALGAVGGLLGAPWGPAGVVAAAGIAGLYAVRELLGVPVPLPDRHRQVPEWWRAFFPPRVAAFLYGAALGVGFLTFLRHGTLVAVAAVAVASGDPALGALVVAPFGIARGLSVAVVASGRTDDRVAGVVDRLDGLAMSRWPRLVNGAALLAVGSAVVVAGLPRDGSGPHPLVPLALAVVFGWAAVAKAARVRAWRAALRGYSLPRAIERAALVGVPAAEAAVVALVLAGAPKAAGALALGLLTAFSVPLLQAWRSGRGRLPCGCFGGRRDRDVRWLLARSGGLAIVAAGALGAPARLPVGVPRAGEMLPALLVAAGAAIGVALLRRTVQLFRDAGRSALRDRVPAP